tara:strand:+ start:15128 stop:15355 length:228 start_codon:yes stop_codon:yes gene_type:complete
MKNFLPDDDLIDSLVPFSFGAITMALVCITGQFVFFNPNAVDKCKLKSGTHTLIIADTFLGDAYTCQPINQGKLL